MKKYLAIGLLMLGSIIPWAVQAENTQATQDYWALNASDPFLEPHCPLMDPVSLFVLRQKLTLQANQTIVEAQLGNDTSNSDDLRKARIELYLPIIDTSSFQYLVGTKYKQTDIVAEDSETFGKTARTIWLFNAFKYVFDERSNFIFILENYERGIDKSFGEDPGNQVWGYGMYNYAFSKEWQLMIIAGYEENNMAAGQNKYTPQIAPEVRWEPNDSFKLVFGAPSIACEWTMTPDWGVAGYFLLLNQDAGAFVRYKINKEYSLSLVYSRAVNETQKTYFDRQTYQLPGTSEMITYSNLAQSIDQISLDLGIRTNQEVGLNISCGYAFGGTITLRDNLDKTGTTPGKNEAFLRVQVQHLKLWD